MSSSLPVASAGDHQSGLNQAAADLNDSGQRHRTLTHSIRAIGIVHLDGPDDFVTVAERTTTLELTEEFASDALAGLGAFSHTEILLLMDHVSLDEVETGAQRPHGRPDWPLVGIFAQRDANRPNRIHSAVAEIVSVSGTRLIVRGLDVIDQTPVIDIKPLITGYLPSGKLKQPLWADELAQLPI